jgi:hypothetical protein
MNQPPTPLTPEHSHLEPPIEPERNPDSPTKKDLRQWFRRLLACNPFYLGSVALLLYGCYRVSMEPKVFNNESAHLYFNFASLQVYELLLATTAILLARRRIWYDSTLLVGLENLLLLVPFVLISQASLIDRRMLSVMCLIAGCLAVVRLTSVKTFIRELNFPRRLLVIGWIVLLSNLLLPAVYRILHENKFGSHLESGAAYYTNECMWLVIFPLLCGLAALIPPTSPSGTLWPQRHWMPFGLFALWIAGTGVHLYCLGYVYDFDLRGELLAPGIWMVLWMLRLRINEIVPVPRPAWSHALCVAPVLAAFVAWTPAGSKVCLALMLLNAAVYGGLLLYRCSERLALPLLLFSLFAAIAGFPENWAMAVWPGFTRATGIVGALAVAFLLVALNSRSPKIGLLGAFIVAGVGLRVGHSPHWALQAGLAFLLLHSLRWSDNDHSGARALRWIAAVAWIIHALLWTHYSGTALTTFSMGAFVLAGYLVVRLVKRTWGPIIVPVAAAMVILSGPGDLTVGKLQSIPFGLVAIAGSFLLFGVGTAAALTRHHWHQADPPLGHPPQTVEGG